MGGDGRRENVLGVMRTRWIGEGVKWFVLREEEMFLECEKNVNKRRISCGY